jgi:hypothetical protein
VTGVTRCAFGPRTPRQERTPRNGQCWHAMQQAIPRLAGDIAPFDYAQGRLWQGGSYQKQDRSSTMLPQAHRVFTGINLRFERQPRTSCYEHALRGPFRRREILPHSTTLRAGSGRAEVTRSCSPKNSQCEFFGEQEKRSTMLPQAHRAFIWTNVRFEQPPRNSC